MPSGAPVQLHCLRCGTAQTVKGYDPSRKYRCLSRDCGGDLLDPAEAKTVRADTPAEVSRAAEDPRNRIGKYILLRELGRGGMGVVYKAWDSSLKRWVAVKFLILPGSDEDLKRFQREAQTAASLKHPNIASIYEVGEADGKPYISMEYVEGQNLHGLKLGVRRACEIMHQVALALDFAHRHSIIHRDLKPGNILLDSDDKPTILDFGLAKSMKDAARLTISGMVVGTPSYMSPEQAEGLTGQIGPRSDIYQLGAVLYELVTGRPPFRGESAAQILRRVVDEEAIPPSRLASVPADVETIVVRAMDKDPRRRYPSAKAFADDLERFLKGESIVARPASTFTRAKRLLRRHKAIAAGAVALLFLAFAGGAWLSQRASARDAHLRQGDAEYGQRQYQKALELYSRALELDRENADIKLKLEECRKQMRLASEKGAASEKGKVAAEEAKVRAERATAEEKARAALRDAARPAYQRGQDELDEAVKDLYRHGTDLVKTRARLVTAIAAFTESLGKWPENPDALHSRGRARAFRFETDEADRDFARAIELRPDFAAARTERGKLLLQRYIEARFHLGWEWSEEVARPFAKGKDQAKIVMADEAWVAFAEGKLEECLRLCDRRLKEKREQEELWKLKGDALYFGAGSVIEGNLNEPQALMLRSAVEAYSEAIRLRPNYYEARMMRGYVYKQGGNAKLAMEDVRVAHALRPDDALACWFMGQAAAGADPAKALEWYEQGLKINPDSFICRMNRAAMLGQLERYEEARSELDRSMGLNPAHYYPVYLRGALRSKTGDMEGAYEDFRKSTSMAPGFHSGWFNLGATAYNTRRWREAISAMERALQAGHPERASCENVIRLARRQVTD